MKKFIYVWIFALIFSLPAQAQKLEATVNRNPVPQGEAFILSLTLKDARSALSPNLQPLEKDFNIYSIQNATNISYINGQQSQEQEWNVGLIALQPGKITIPSISVGNFSSQPLTLNVLEAGAIAETKKNGAESAQNPQPRFAMSGAIDNHSPFVQQQVNYTLTVLDSGGLQLQAPIFLDQNPEDWSIMQSAEPQVQTKTINGQTMREIKFFYALFPQKSGKLTVPEVRLNGQYLTKGQRNFDPFAALFDNALNGSGFSFADTFAAVNPVTLTTKPIAVEVKPIPQANNGQWWLPAEKVSLAADWEPNNPKFKVGETVNRVIQLTAVGVIKNQLPNLNFPKIQGLKQYPEKPESDNVFINGKVAAVEKAAVVYIPTQAGNITLPEIAVSWYNTQTNKMEKSVIPAVTIKVAPADGSSTAGATEPPKSSPDNQNSFDSREQNMEQVIDEAESFSVAETTPNSWLYLFVALAFGLGILISYLIFKPRQKEENALPTIRNYQKYIHQKATQKDFRALRDALIDWTATRHPGERVTNLKEVAKLNPQPEFEHQIGKLMEELYANNSANWDAVAFNKAFDKAYKSSVRGSESETLPLPRLYK